MGIHCCHIRTITLTRMMLFSFSIALLICSAAAFEVKPAENLNIVPNDVAYYMREAVRSAGWYTANSRYGYDGSHDLESYNEMVEVFTDRAKDLLSAEVLQKIADMFIYSAWGAANERVGYYEHAERDRETMWQLREEIRASGQMTDDLVDNTYEMGWAGAWYTANCRWGYDYDKDEANFIKYYDDIRGQYNLIAMNFFPEHAVLVNEQKTIITNQVLVNGGAVDQSFSFEFEIEQGTTSATSHDLDFEFDIEAEFSARFLWFFKFYLSVDFGFHVHAGWMESLMTGTALKYTFPLIVPPESSYKAEAYVQEGTMEVPYEIVFLCDGEEQKLTGLWKGTAVSTAYYEITECGPREC